MDRLRNAALAFVLVAFCTHLAGCAAGGTGGSERAGGHELPDWVRIVVPEKDGRAFFVGGVSFAVDAEAGIRAAEADAHSQIHLKAVRHFTQVFNKGIQGSGVETEPIQRMDLKNAISNTYGNRMTEMAVREKLYHRPCGDSDGESAPAEDGSGAPVCQVFVLMSVGDTEWDSVLGEVMAIEKRRRAEEGEDNLVEYIDWMMREVLEQKTEEDRER
jgi:hypothetical protein